MAIEKKENTPISREARRPIKFRGETPMNRFNPSLPDRAIVRFFLQPRCLLWLSALMVFALPARADLLVLKDGRELRGRVINLGTNAVELRIRPGFSRHIFLKDIERASFDLQSQKLPSDKDIVFRKNGSEVAGKVGFSKDGSKVIVSRPDGANVVIPRSEVAQIIKSDQVALEGAAVYSQGVEKSIENSISQILRGDSAGSTEAVERAEKLLKSYGIFAIDEVRKARAKVPEGSPAAKSLDRVIRLYQIKELTPDVLQNFPDYYRVISSGSSEEKENLLVEMFTRYVNESVPVTRFLILESGEDPQIRALAVALLGKNGLNRDLIEIYNEAKGGQVQLAAAVALARNRILVGAETLIDALDLYRPEIRELAFKTLQQATGKDFGFDVHDTPSARRIAVSKWKRWWAENSSAIQDSAAAALTGTTQNRESSERKKAWKLWQQGSQAMDRGAFDEAEEKLRAAVKIDPTFFNGKASLAILLCLHRGKGEEGRGILEQFLLQRPADMGPRESIWIFYYLGLAWEVEGDFEKAELRYRNALWLDRKFFRAAKALGDLNFRLATAKASPKEGSRRDLLGNAENWLRNAITLMEEYTEGLEILSFEDVASEMPPAFERQEHNRNIVDLKDNIRQKRAEVHLSLAKIRALLDDRPRAIAELNSAVEVLRETTRAPDRSLLIDLHNYRGFLFEEEGMTAQALEDYYAVLQKDMDPENKVAREGIRRLSAKRGDGSPRTTYKSKRSLPTPLDW